MQKKALIFSVAYYPYLIGGAEVAIKEITDRLAGQIDFDLITVYAGESRLERIGNVNVYRVGFKVKKTVGKSLPTSKFIRLSYIFFAFIKGWQLYQKNRKNQYSFMWASMASYGGFAAAYLKSVLPSFPFVLTLQEGESFKKKMNKVWRRFFSNVFKKADHIQTISNYLREWAITMGATCPITVVPNGVDFNFFSATPASSQIKALREEIGLVPDDFVLITTSRLVEKNAVGDIIDSLTLLEDKVKLVIIGIGEEEKMLKKKVSLLKFDRRVFFIGFVPYKEIPIYLHLANVFIRPSLSEGFGNSFIEAMACDLPVIATAVGGIVDFMYDGRTGLICSVKNPRSIADKVKVLMSDNNLKDGLIKNAREMVKERYDWNLVSRKMKEEVFEKVRARTK